MEVFITTSDTNCCVPTDRQICQSVRCSKTNKEGSHHFSAFPSPIRNKKVESNKWLDLEFLTVDFFFVSWRSRRLGLLSSDPRDIKALRFERPFRRESLGLALQLLCHLEESFSASVLLTKLLISGLDLKRIGLSLLGSGVVVDGGALAGWDPEQDDLLDV